MGREVTVYLSILVGLMLLQLVVLGNMPLTAYTMPWIYILCILILPSGWSRWVVLSMAFAVGMAMDASYSSYGVHTVAMTTVGYLRPYALRMLLSKNRSREWTQGVPSLPNLGWLVALKYYGTLALLHSLLVQGLSSLPSPSLVSTVVPALSSAALTLFLIMAIQLLVAGGLVMTRR